MSLFNVNTKLFSVVNKEYNHRMRIDFDAEIFYLIRNHLVIEIPFNKLCTSFVGTDVYEFEISSPEFWEVFRSFDVINLSIQEDTITLFGDRFYYTTPIGVTDSNIDFEDHLATIELSPWSIPLMKKIHKSHFYFMKDKDGNTISVNNHSSLTHFSNSYFTEEVGVEVIPYVLEMLLDLRGDLYIYKDNRYKFKLF